MKTYFIGEFDDFVICPFKGLPFVVNGQVHVSQYFDIPLGHQGPIRFRNGATLQATDRVFYVFKICLN